MTQKKDDAIKGIVNDFENMANLVLTQLDILEGILNSGELVIPDGIKEQIDWNEEKLDKMEVKLSEKIVNTIVLYQPMASDIRKIIACQRMTTNLERIGDYVKNISRFISQIESPEMFGKMTDIFANMFSISLNMVRKALISFLNEDKDLAIWTIKNDEEIGALNRKMLQKVISKAPENPDLQKLLTSFITFKEIIQNIERIADHAANIAEAAIYSFEGKDVRHHNFDE